MGAFTGRVWSVVRKFVRTASGRKRFNVLGALNFVTKKIETVVNTTYITSTQIIEMLEKLSGLHTGKVVNVVLDNASYQRCKLVQGKAISLGINLVFLPTYSPNLNLIERVWKLVKSRVLNSVYHETFPVFCGNIEKFINVLHTDFAPEMENLITEKFQIIDLDNVI
jgi:transposase